MLAAAAVPAVLLAGAPGWPGLSLLLFAAASAVGWVWWTVKPRRLTLRGDVHAEDGALYLDDVRLANRRELRVGHVVPAAQGASVVILDDRGFERFVVELESTAEAEALLSALRLDVDRAVIELSVWGSGPRTATWMLGAGLALPAVALGSFAASAFVQHALGATPLLSTYVMLVAILLSLVVATYLWHRSRVRISVGPDGVSVARRSGRRFVRYQDIDHLAWWPGRESGEGVDPSEGFDVVLRTGERIPLRTIDLRLGDGHTGRCPLHQRIRSGMACGATRAGSVERALMRRPADGVKAWVGALRATGVGAGDTLRTPPTTTDTLWSLVEDPRAEPVSRAAAAVSLTSGGDPGARLRIEEISESVASPDLKALLESCVEEAGDVEASMELLVAKSPSR